MNARSALTALLAAIVLLAAPAPAHAVPPECDPELTVPTVESTPLFIWLREACRDPDTANLSYAVVSDPAHGELLGPTPFESIYYTPDDGFVGTDTFTYKASDGTGESGVVTVTIAVNETQPPQCDTSTQLDVEPDMPTQFEAWFFCFDPDFSGPLTFAEVEQPAHGTVTVDAFSSVLIYEPVDGYRGPDSFTFKASDGVAESNVATIEVTVLEPNRPPSCITPVTLTVVVNGTLPLDLRDACSDPDGDELWPWLVSGPSNGTLDFDEYRPNRDFRGTDTFVYVVEDFRGGFSNEATVHIRVVDPPQRPPQGQPKEPAKGPPKGTAKGPAVTPADTTAPSVAFAATPAQRLRSVRRKGLGLQLELSEPAFVEIELFVGRRAARRLGIRRKVGSAVQVLPGDRSTVTVKLTRKARKAFRRTREVKLRIALAATDVAGNRAEQAETLTLRRR